MVLNIKHTGLVLGVILAFVVLMLPVPQGMKPEALYVAAVAVLMASWWMTEALPLAATALIPVLLFPTMGVMDARAVTSAYADDLIFLFMGGFFLAATIQKWNLHKRIALHTIRIVGTTPKRITLGFMLGTAFLSMWVSNTATAMMMLPIGMAVVSQASATIESEQQSADIKLFATGLMLAIAYSASIGGVATLIGTPPNAILAGVIERQFDIQIKFVDWFMFAFPLAMFFLLVCWWYLTRIAFPVKMNVIPGGNQLIHRELDMLGKVSPEEKKVLFVFLLVATAWMLNGLFDFSFVIKDSTIAIAGALLLFILPARNGSRLLDWETAQKIPWDILILFGGGFALANGFMESGLSHWLGVQLSVLKGMPLAIVILASVLLVIFLTELTSNTATATLFLPVMAALSISLAVDPLSLMAGVAIAASFAFMLPVATPPNAIVFASRKVTVMDMAKTGFWMNIIACILIVLFVTQWLPLVF